jgi:hypothetical protein
MDDRSMLKNWSEHYRGIDIAFVKKLPAKILERELVNAKRQSEFWREELQRLETMESAKVDINDTERNRQRRKMNKIYRENGLHHLVK